MKNICIYYEKKIELLRTLNGVMSQNVISNSIRTEMHQSTFSNFYNFICGVQVIAFPVAFSKESLLSQTKTLTRN